MIDPTRPLAQGNAPARLAEALQQARAALGTTEQVARVRQGLGALPELAAGASAATASTSGAVSAASTLGKLLALLVLGGAGLWLATAEPNAEPSPATSAGEAPPSQEPKAAAPVPTIEPVDDAPVGTTADPSSVEGLQASSEPLPREKTAQPLRRAARSTRSGPRRAPAATAAPARDSSAELELLERAQRRIEQSPQQALALLDEHATRFPEGFFAQERERLAVDALRKLGRRTAARARAERFLARFPNSPHGRSIEAWLRGGSPPAPAPPKSSAPDARPTGAPIDAPVRNTGVPRPHTR